MNRHKIEYAIDGGLRRFRQARTCPSCGAREARRVDRKWFHELLRCDRCALLYRWPYETREEMARFYQHSYQQSGLTTDVPSVERLQQLIACGFRGTEKDFSRIIQLFQALSVPLGARILDFGANWGYGVWQLKRAGYAATGYELSVPRASYSKHLDVEVLTEWSDIERRAPFDVVFSSHVLEHTPDPAHAVRQMRQVLAPGGWLVALFPNGADAFRRANPWAFHRLWGQVHPVLLDDKFIRTIMPDARLAFGACCPADIEALRQWDRREHWTGTVDTGELLVVGTSP